MSSDFSIRKATIADLAEILPIYDYARNFMRENGNPTQWGNAWPPQRVIEQDLASGNSYAVMYENRIACIFFCAVMDEPTYQKIDGQWLNDEPYAVIHRIASSGICRGAAAFAINWALETFRNVRIDTHERNKPMRHLLEEKLHFIRCGIGTMTDGSPRILYQKSQFQKSYRQL